MEMRTKNPSTLHSRRKVFALGGAMAIASGAYAWRRYDLGARLYNPLTLGNFELPAVAGLKNSWGDPVRGFSNSDLDHAGPTLVALFASWCGYCREERPLLEEVIKKSGARAFGVMVKDDADDALAYFEGRPPPFQAVGDDSSGYFMRMMGARGVPATFVFSSAKTLAFKTFGVLSEPEIEERLMPALKA